MDSSSDDGLRLSNGSGELGGQLKQRLGLFGLLSEPVPYPIEHPGCLMMDTLGGESVCYYLMPEEYEQIALAYKQCDVAQNEFLFLWVEEDQKGVMQRWHLFKAPFDLQFMMQVFSACYDVERVIVKSGV